MSLLFGQQRRDGWGGFGDPTRTPTWAEHSSRRGRGEAAMRHSAAWAAIRLRADLLSSMPLDVYRRMPDGVQVAVAPPPVLVNPSPSTRSVSEWLYASQVDLDRYGNAFGQVAQRDSAGRPARIDLVEAACVSVRLRVDGSVEYRYNGQLVDSRDVWHERQYPIAGLPVGLSPVAHSALAVSMYLSAQEFAADWFDGGVGMPNGVLRNEAKVLSATEADVHKKRFKASVRSGEPFVTGKDWTFTPVTAASNDASWLSTQNASAVDVARFFGVPADLIDAPQSGASITYANVTQRNLQLLITNIGPAVNRREEALSSLLTAPRYVKLNTDALLRLDPQTRSAVLGQQIRDRFTAPSEARALMDREPFSEEQLAEFDRLFGTRSVPPVSQGVPA